jgi:hypothetical protein
MSFWKVVLLLGFVGSVKAGPNVTNLVKESGLVFNGTCPKIYKNFTELDPNLVSSHRNLFLSVQCTYNQFNHQSSLGSWYILYGKLSMFEQGKKCAFLIFNLENGTVHVTRYETDLRFEYLHLSKLLLCQKSFTAIMR